MNSFLSNKFNILSQAYVKSLRMLVYALVFISGIGIFSMIFVTCGDIILRRFGHAFIGAYDIVKIAGAITLASALPYTTAVKGHVAIEYFFQKLHPGLRVVVDAIIRVLVMTFFGFLGWRSCVYGNQLHKSNQVTQTLQLPIFWLPYFIGFCCFVVLLVIAYKLVHTKAEMIKP